MNATASSREISDPRLSADPLVSICILVYNHEDCLDETLESVLSQQASFPFEVLVGEDCSTDTSRAIALRLLAKYPESVRIITAERNVGAFENGRRLLRATRGRFIASLDGDDHWLPGKLATQVAFLHDNPDCVAVYTNALAIDKDGRTLGLFNDLGTARFDLAMLVRNGNFLNSSSLMYRAGLKPALLDMQGELMDYRVHLSIASRGMIGHIGRPLVAYRVNSAGSIMASDNTRVRELYWQALRDVPRELVSDDDYAHGLADFLRRVFFRALRTRDLSLWRQWKLRVLAAAPCGAIWISLLTATNIARTAVKETLGRSRRDASGRSLRVLYRL